MMFVSDLLSKFGCTYCQDEISGVLIKCVECKDLVLCLQCFAAGAEIGPHKNDHAYQFIDSDAQDLFKSRGGWSAREELLLLNGVEGYGFGNWKDIALKLENRTAEECKDEYVRTFLEGSIGRRTWPKERPHTMFEGSGGGSSTNQRHLAPVVISQEQADLLDYMPNRDDFEKEYNNNAESIISNLNISFTDDDELDVALKLAQVDMYVEELRERRRRKRVATDYQLISKFFNSLYLRSKANNPEQTEVEERLRFLCQFVTCQEFESLVSSWMQEISLRRRGSELVRYRVAGLTRYEEIPHYEQESIFRSDTKPWLLLNPNSSPGRRWSGAPALELAAEEDSESSRSAQGCSGAAGTETWSKTSAGQECCRPPPTLSPHHHAGSAAQPPPHRPPPYLTRPGESERNEGIGCSSTERNFTYPTDIPRSSRQTEPEQERRLPQQQQQPQPQPLIDQPSHLLSPSESQLCACLDLTPTQYISIKTHLLTKCTDMGESLAEQPIINFINTNCWFVG